MRHALSASCRSHCFFRFNRRTICHQMQTNRSSRTEKATAFPHWLNVIIQLHILEIMNIRKTHNNLHLCHQPVIPVWGDFIYRARPFRQCSRDGLAKQMKLTAITNILRTNTLNIDAVQRILTETTRSKEKHTLKRYVTITWQSQSMKYCKCTKQSTVNWTQPSRSKWASMR